ncbi:hypothetical protein HDU96_005456, partial [Phlyctochytrium bullatum]
TDSLTYGSVGFNTTTVSEPEQACTSLASTLLVYAVPPTLPPAAVDKATYPVVIATATYDRAIQTDAVIITALPKSLIPRDYHCVALICARINDQLHPDTLLDTGADINVITRAALRQIKSRYGRRVQVHPFPYERQTEGVGGYMTLDGYCVLEVAPGRQSRAVKSLAFNVIQHSPRPIILGMPTINAFHMDLCTSSSELRFFWEEIARDGTTSVQYDITPLKTTHEGFTFERRNPNGPPQ